MGDSQITAALLQAFLLLLFAGSVLGIAIGAALLWRTEAALRFFAAMNHWVSTRILLKPLEVPRSIAGRSGQRRWVVGTLFLLGGAYAASMLALKTDAAKTTWMLGIYGPGAGVAEIVVDTLRWFFVAGGIAAVALGVMLIAFPKAWAALEARADHWYSTRQLTMGGDDMHIGLDRWVARFPRAAGAVIVVLSLIPGATSALLLYSSR